MMARFLSPPFWTGPGGPALPIQIGDSTYTARFYASGDSHTIGGIGGASSWSFAWQIGPLLIANCDIAQQQCLDGNVWTLVYAEVDGTTYGALPVPTASGPPPNVSGASLAITPNPARGSVTLDMRLAAAGLVRAQVIDALGRLVISTDYVELASGAHRILLDTSALAAGWYTVRVAAGELVVPQRLVIVR
jgi:hypothetical protein